MGSFEVKRMEELFHQVSLEHALYPQNHISLPPAGKRQLHLLQDVIPINLHAFCWCKCITHII